MTTQELREAVIEQIRAAFAGVGREGGVSLHEADVIDDYGSPEERAAARQLDTEDAWEHVPGADIDHYYSVLTFLDPIGLRYYLAAYMVWILRHYDHTDSMSVDFTLYTLNHGALQWTLGVDHRPLFTPAQSAAICSFLRYMAADELRDFVDTAAALRALRRYWGQFCL